MTPTDGRAPMPTPAVTMTLADYDFVLSSPLTAGAHVIEVKNAAMQPHEVFIWAARWASRRGAPTSCTST